MKSAIIILLSTIALSYSVANKPTYKLTTENLNRAAPNVMEFDIYLQHTNSNDTKLEYILGQYFFEFNPEIANGGELTYSLISSELPSSLQPRNPSVTGNQLRLVTNSVPAKENLPVISDKSPGTLVAKMRLETSAKTFSDALLELKLRVGPENPFTKIFAYLGTTSTDITNRGTYSVDSGNVVLPVELASFTSSVNRNNVTLNWATNKEINNSGFDVERKLASASDWTKVGNIPGNGNSNEAKNYTFSERANTGKYNYRLKQIDYNGNFAYFPLLNEVVVGVPDKYNMSQNYPNPFNPTTKIDYDIPYDGKVSILLYDMTGREIANLVNEVKTAGYYTVQLNASDFASGMYFYRITAQGNNNNFVMTKKMVLIK